TSSLRTQLCYALCTLGTLEQARGNQEEARAYYEQALKVARAAASVGGEGRALAHLADTYLQENNASYAVHLLRDALPRLNMSGDIEWSSYFVGQLGRGLILSGHEAEGERLLYRALRIAEQMKHIRLERQWALLLAGRAAEGMRYEEALRLYRQALPLLRDDASTRTRTLCEASRICLYLDDRAGALDYARQAFELAQSSGDDKCLPLARGTLGMALRTSGQNAEAIPYLDQAVRDMPADADSGVLRLEIMRTLAAARAETGDAHA